MGKKKAEKTIREKPHGEEKKVEYLELIYDLIFVYVIGRNNSLLHHAAEGGINGSMFLAYVLCTLAIIQIWNFSIYYINMHGRNGLRDHIFLFTNMYLLYYIAEGTRAHWEAYQSRYHAAWGLILLNIGIQYIAELRNHKDDPQITSQLKRMVFVLFGEAAIVFAAIPVFSATGKNLLALPAILFGMIAASVHGRNAKVVLVDFAHLSERAMLYVVFSFGEMIIALSAYFEGDLTGNTVYFSLMSFLIAVGLFLSYGTFYDHIIDREIACDGLNFMFVHIFLIFALNNITTSLEFMHDESVELLPKMVFLIVSLLLFYAALFSLSRYAKKYCRPKAKHYAVLISSAAVFALLMMLFREDMYVNIAVTVVYVAYIYILLYRFGRKMKA